MRRDPPHRLVTESSGPGDGAVWRLELDLAEVVWDDYYPFLADHYRAAFS